MKRIKRSISILMVMSLVLVLAACGGDEASGNDSDKTYSFKLAHITPTNHMWHLAAEKFAEELESKSDGRMKVEIYPASQLGTEADMVQQIEAGSVDFGLITAAYMSSRSPSFAAWFMPYAFEDINAAHEARTSDVAKKILGTLDDQGLVGLDYLFAGQRVMLFKDKEVLSPEDMSGLKLRVTPSPPMQDFYRSAGASPEGLPLPEVYAAVQTGVIDGMDMDLDAAITNKYYEVVQYGAVTNHMVWPSVAIVNKSMFEGMSEADQKIVRDALTVATDFAVSTRSAQEEEFRQELSDNGMKIYDIPAEAFADQIAEFDAKYKEEDPLIKEFIEAFRK
ncbi:MAG: DctP family TRAP transporter solute-binding subunit [Bacillota bacterium]